MRLLTFSIAAALAVPAAFALAEAPPPSTAPAGGEVVNDAGLDWRLTVPEGWKWRQRIDAEGKASLVVYTAGVPDDAATIPDAAKPGDVYCATIQRADEESKGKTQADANEALQKIYDESVKVVFVPLTGSMLEASSTEIREIKG